MHGGAVFSAFATIPRLRWSVFVEQSVREAFSPLYETVVRTLVLLIIGLGLAIAASLILARSMIRPIHALQAGAKQIGAGALEHRIDVHTGDELEMLADRFNSMAGQLHESYANLEQKVEARTMELTEALMRLKALGEVSRAVNSTLDLETVLTTIISRAVQLSDTVGGVIYEYDKISGEFQPQIVHRMEQELVHAVHTQPVHPDGTAMGRAAASRTPVQVPDILREHGHETT
jgi:nitrate/nitrite-specific signal transduction histidine kinase